MRSFSRSFELGVPIINTYSWCIALSGLARLHNFHFLFQLESIFKLGTSIPSSFVVFQGYLSLALFKRQYHEFLSIFQIFRVV